MDGGGWTGNTVCMFSNLIVTYKQLYDYILVLVGLKNVFILKIHHVIQK